MTVFDVLILPKEWNTGLFQARILGAKKGDLSCSEDSVPSTSLFKIHGFRSPSVVDIKYISQRDTKRERTRLTRCRKLDEHFDHRFHLVPVK
jgi:hypothetical protein